ncbi:hypothetical protein E1A91_A06G150500v1 [Gossypium mustelinum]|uniref:Uncharacterized protein n=1 Tax=Gossypium mustelinum TaxID=34275 RepID=A0A5D2Z0E5_GOSMU|nr:hypothetical protein E1A91_A06G150500v1 [Gossypium mustelinum]
MAKFLFYLFIYLFIFNNIIKVQLAGSAPCFYHELSSISYLRESIVLQKEITLNQVLKSISNTRFNFGPDYLFYLRLRNI